MIYPEELAAIETVILINSTAATDVFDFEGGKLAVIGLRLDKNAPIVNKKLIEIALENPSADFRVVAIQRNFKNYHSFRQR